MNTNAIGQMAYLGILACAIGGYAIVRYRGRIGTMMQHAALWVLIFVGVVAAIGLWGDIRHTLVPFQRVEQGVIEVPRARDGHYYLTVSVNGTAIRMIVDTGATDLVLSHDDAAAAGIDLDGLAYFGRAATANGTVRIAPVRLKTIELGPVSDKNFRAFVSEGKMPASLLGMSYLQNFSRIEIENGALVLTR
ncbi:TIGR02281 family clan AA aspartic protease [Pseudooceanicola sp.]|uniref:retropepsin-like aspartic protease family protein n=1 Tax=Pseudooceanicola sp. TaxID=1914328 RepID=UPI00261077F3|nr:TIGR02281 family clan AA aspartic protease [Pseudooceanicola sp.]MDF1857129.1 TIGR02281 family clan AA aspartic protease [Pseudooceanicola sp.]